MQIFVAIPSTRHDQWFMDSLKYWSSVSKYDLKWHFILNRDLAEAQNQFAHDFLKSKCKYLLFLDDDHSDHSDDMLDCLIEADAYMATIKSYSRHYPYSCALMRRIPGSYAGIENGKGYRLVDLCGFPMTLIRRDLFERLEPPYFRTKGTDMRSWATDREFCERLDSLGIKPVGCFQHCLTHQGINDMNVQELRYKNKQDNQALWLLFNKRMREG